MALCLTLFGRSLLLLLAEVFANAVCWVVAAILFAPNPDTRQILSLALLAWTLGLRHALDADHISAIDNATRGLISLGQLPVTCGLFFSLGHSTIVIVVTVAIAISSDVYDKIHGVGEVGGIVGAAVSGSFLFVVGLANSFILWRIIKQQRERRKRDGRVTNGEAGIQELEEDPKHNHMFMMRILGPIITFVNKPWKMYPVGVLFGFGFDTASSIALLAVSAIAKKGRGGQSIPSSHIVILPLLFTSGMTLLDSVDSIIMLYSYTAFPDHSWKILERREASPEPSHMPNTETDIKPVLKENEPTEKQTPVSDTVLEQEPQSHPVVGDEQMARNTQVKMNVMSGLSIVLTLMSILVAFSISLITIMGLIGEQCSQCVAAAEADDGGGLAGRWWRGWANANEQSGYIGIAIVGGFVLIVGGWYIIRWARRRGKR